MIAANIYSTVIAPTIDEFETLCSAVVKSDVYVANTYGEEARPQCAAEFRAAAENALAAAQRLRNSATIVFATATVCGL